MTVHEVLVQVLSEGQLVQVLHKDRVTLLICEPVDKLNRLLEAVARLQCEDLRPGLISDALRCIVWYCFQDVLLTSQLVKHYFASENDLTAKFLVNDLVLVSSPRKLLADTNQEVQCREHLVV